MWFGNLSWEQWLLLLTLMECDLYFTPSILVATVGKVNFVGFCFEGLYTTGPVKHDSSLLCYSLHGAMFKLALISAILSSDTLKPRVPWFSNRTGMSVDDRKVPKYKKPFYHSLRYQLHFAVEKHWPTQPVNKWIFGIKIWWKQTEHEMTRWF